MVSGQCPPLIGLPQGSALSSVRFNIVLARVDAAVLYYPTTMSAIFYAVDVYIWASRDSFSPLQIQLESAVDHLVE